MRCDDGIDFVGGAEEKRAVDAEDRDVRRNFLVLQNVRVAFLQVFCGHLGNRGGFGDLANVNERGENHAGFDGDSEVGENGEKESDQPGSNLQGR